MKETKNTDSKITKEQRLKIIEKSTKQVSRGVFFSTLIIVVSFLPVFLLEDREGKLFHPLAWTKTFILITDAFLAITLAPVLVSFFVRGKRTNARPNPINRFLERIYSPLIRIVLKRRKTVLALNISALIIAIPLLKNMGSEFMPPLDEQSILFMPVSLPDISNEEASRLLKIQDKIIKSVPEVDKVLGKAGRAATATDNSPVSMIETIIMLKPKNLWRKGLDKNALINELDSKLKIPGITNGWTQPIINRINMLSTGIRTDAGIKIFGPNIDSIDALSMRIKNSLEGVEGISDLFAEPLKGGKYISVNPNKYKLARYGISVKDINETIETALGGTFAGNIIEGRKRFDISVRYAPDYRSSTEKIKNILIASSSFGPIPLSEVADVVFEDGPPMISSENAMLRGVVMFNVRNGHLGGTIKNAMQKLALSPLPEGYFLEWSGRYEDLSRSRNTLMFIIPLVIIIIFGSLYFAFNSVKEAFLSLVTIPFALVGGVYAVYFWGASLSVAVAAGFIALFGIAVETGIVMVIYLNDAMRYLVEIKGNSSDTISKKDLEKYVIIGAAGRLRPKLMTVCVSLFGLVPVLWSDGVGMDVMKPIALPMIGGVLTSGVHILLTTPLIFLMTKEYELRKYGKLDIHAAH